MTNNSIKLPRRVIIHSPKTEEELTTAVKIAFSYECKGRSDIAKLCWKGYQERGCIRIFPGEKYKYLKYCSSSFCSGDAFPDHERMTVGEFIEKFKRY